MACLSVATLGSTILNLVRFYKQRRSYREPFAEFYGRFTDAEITNVATTGKRLGR